MALCYVFVLGLFPTEDDVWMVIWHGDGPSDMSLKDKYNVDFTSH
jgi:hypothetical protein